jgi:foldase protein PrsA
MKRAIAAVVVLLLLASTVALAACGERKVPAGAIAAVGKDGVVTQEEFDAIMGQAKAQYAAQEGAPPFPEEGSEQYNQLKANIVNYLVNNELIRQEAAEMNVSVTKEEIDARMKEIVEQVGGQKKLEELLEKQGVKEEDLRTQLEAQMLQDEVRTEVAKNVTVTEEEMKAYFDDPANKEQFTQAATVDARHVLVKSKADANKVQALLKADGSDANWKKVAKEYSTDPGSKNSGGSLGSFPEGRMVPQFEKVAFSIKVNTISEPVKTQFGYHVIEVTKKTASSNTSFEDAKPMIEQQLKYQGEAEAWETWLKEAEAEAEIVYAPGYDPAQLTAAPSPAPDETPEGTETRSPDGSPSPSPSE